MFACGAGNFSHMDHDDPRPPSPPRPPPPKGKRHHSKNPYAARGLDKFSMVLAELETRREKIMAKAGAQGVEIIQFACDNSQDWVPIVVRPREGKGPQPPTEAASEEAVKIKDEKKKREEVVVVLKKPLVGLKLRWRYERYWPAVVVLVLILVCLLMFGRVFAICCTSVWWYAVPTMRERWFVGKKKNRKERLGRERVTRDWVSTRGKKL